MKDNYVYLVKLITIQRHRICVHPIVTVKWMNLLPFFLEIPVSNLGTEAGYYDRIFMDILSSLLKVQQQQLHGLSPRANYTDRATAALKMQG
jgi:hypothetical protein